MAHFKIKIMAKKKKKEELPEEKSSGKKTRRVKEETTKTVLSILCFVVAAVLLLAAFDKAGLVGTYTFSSLSYLLGIGYYLIPTLLIILGVTFIRLMHGKVGIVQGGSALVSFIAGLGIIHSIEAGRGGVIGSLISAPLLSLFDFTVTLIALIALEAIALLVLLDAHLDPLAWFRKKDPKEKNVPEKSPRIIGETEDDGSPVLEEERVPTKKLSETEVPKPEEKQKKIKIKEQEESDFALPQSASFGAYVPPSLDLLEKDKGKPGVGDIKANANVIKRTLQNFGITVEMDEITIGPTVTRYALKPAEGVKLSRIVGLQDDLSLALSAHPIRIEAPIPGKSLVGIEIPNTTKTVVGLGSLLGTADFQTSEKPLLMALGKAISGKAQYGNMAKMPHLLIAGTTGSGKSVTIHALLTSLLYRNSPEMLKFIMVDPKRVELTLYNKIPHLLTPVITDAKKAILALKWAAKEMERRYDILEKNSCRDIDSYHKNIVKPKVTERQAEIVDMDPADIEHLEPLPDPMPYIMIVIDELADIMTTYPRELEAGIVRLAQMSRAVGIHLILSTQRPSVNVITGLIKANVPSRIALKVSSQIDSRTIIDMAGAEELIGYGDMLFLSSDAPQPIRLQCAFISEAEVKAVVKYLIDTYKEAIPTGITLSQEQTNNEEFGPSAIFSTGLGDNGSSDLDDDDDLYNDAKAAVTEAGKASTSYIQRKLRVGYSRAARLMDLLEKRGVIGPADGSKPREVIGASAPTETASEETSDDASV